MGQAQTIHFIGIGGAGMSSLAEIFHCKGYKVQGSDIKKTRVTDRLEHMGIHIEKGHSAKNIEGADYVVYSSCIEDSNMELREARCRDIHILRRMEALNMLMGDKNIVAISGSHGKTTTTSLVSFLLIKAGIDPTVFIGGDVDFLDGNAHCGHSALVVTEADESDGSFLLLNPLYSVVTNIDKEHMDYYLSMDRVIDAYKNFIENTKADGCSYVCIEDTNLKELTKHSSKKIVRYGISQEADIRAERIKLLGMGGSVFDFVDSNKVLGSINLSIIGAHNILNSLPAIGIAISLGIDFSFIKDVIGDFKGADRRFTVRHLGSDIFVIDDYAHHPTEIKATLKGIEHSGKRIVACFQPHRYSRTKYLMDEFGSAFDLVDYLVITDIYSAYEMPIDGVKGEDICESVRKTGHKDVHFVNKNGIIEHLVEVVKPGDAVFILGAGDIGELPEKIVNALRTRLGDKAVGDSTMSCPYEM